MHHFNVEQLKATCYSFFTTEGAQIITTRSNPLSLDMLRSTTLADSVCVCVCGGDRPLFTTRKQTQWYCGKCRAA